jgi:succinoglycan biosynthesis protein ExoA
MVSSVSIIAPCRNEVDHIEQFVVSVASQLAPEITIELIVADGDSDDGTVEQLNGLVERYAQLRVVSNPGRIVSTGLNIAVRQAAGDIIVRMDVHTQYDESYVSECVAALRATGAVCVGGPWVASGRTVKQAAIANAFQSPFGSGGAVSRDTNYEGACDTVYLGCWWKRDLLVIGGFDETLVRNQDDELSLRFKKAGGEIWQSPRIRSRYFPRASFRNLFRQFFQYGYWKPAVARKHGQHASLRHFAPIGLVGGFALLAVLAPFVPGAGILGIVLASAYILIVAICASAGSNSRSNRSIFCVGSSLVIMHAAYGIGYALGILDFWITSSGPRKSMFGLTR